MLLGYGEGSCGSSFRLKGPLGCTLLAARLLSPALCGREPGSKDSITTAMEVAEECRCLLLTRENATSRRCREFTRNLPLTRSLLDGGFRYPRLTLNC